MQDSRSVVVGFRLDQDLVHLIDAVAERETRNCSQQIVHWIRRGLRAEGVLET